MVLSHQKRTRVDDQATPGPSSPAQRFLLIVHLNWPCSGYPTFSEPPPKNCILRLCEFVWKLQIAGCFSYVKLHFYCLKPPFFKDRWHSQVAWAHDEEPTAGMARWQGTAKGRSRAAKRDQVTLEVLFVWLEFTFFLARQWLYDG